MPRFRIGVPRELGLFAIGTGATVAVLLATTTVAGVLVVWIALDANPWSQIRDWGIRAAVIWPMIGVFFAGGAVLATFFLSRAAQTGFVAVTALLFILWVLGRRRGRWQQTVPSGPPPSREGPEPPARVGGR